MIRGNRENRESGRWEAHRHACLGGSLVSVLCDAEMTARKGSPGRKV